MFCRKWCSGKHVFNKVGQEQNDLVESHILLPGVFADDLDEEIPAVAKREVWFSKGSHKSHLGVVEGVLVRERDFEVKSLYLSWNLKNSGPREYV